MHPLDRVKTHLQNHPSQSISRCFSEIWAKGGGSTTGGISALYEGIWPMSLEAILKVGTRYYVATAVREEWRSRFMAGDRKKELPFYANMVSGAVAGIIESYLVVIPCELLKIRHMTHPKNAPFVTVAKEILVREGPLALYKGGTSTMLRQVTNHMIRFSVFYEATNYFKGHDASKKLPIWLNFSIGALAGTVSTIANNPLDTIKTRMQSKSYKGEGIPFVLRSLYQERGIRAFWAGTIPRILRVAPGQAITWAVFEKVSALLGAK